MSSQKIDFVILQYNNADDTINCLESVNIIDYPDKKIILIDNDSREEEFLKLKKYISEQGIVCTLIRNQNTGYSGGNNVGIRFALKHGVEIIVILNNDTILPPEFLKKTLSVFDTNRAIGIVGPAINEGTQISYGGKVRWLRPELKHIYEMGRDKPTFFTGACLAIRREVFEKIGFFDERYFLYFEDADFCVRAVKNGYALAIAPIIIGHKVSASTASLGNARRLYLHYRNSLLFNWGDGPLWARILLPLWSMYCIVKQYIKILVFPSRREDSRAIIAGVFSFYQRKFGSQV